MKNGRMQAKDIDDRVFLRMIDEFSRTVYSPTYPLYGPGGIRWVNRWEMAESGEWDWRLVLAKASRLINRKLMTGCTCGCRGDFELTDKGKAFIAAQPE